MDPYVYVGFGAIVPDSDLLQGWYEILEDYEDEETVVILHGEGRSIFVTYAGHYVGGNAYYLDQRDEPIDLTGIDGSTRKEADAIRSVLRRLTGQEPGMLRTHMFVTWS